jgi:5-deoxy-glucuronate isomerase
MTVLRAGGYTEITPRTAGWTYSSLRLVTLTPRRAHEFSTGEEEMLVLPLAGACSVICDGVNIELRGRPGVFSGVSDFAYLPRGARVRLRGEGRFALPGARCARRLEPRYGAADAVPIELRGAGQASRQINGFCMPDAFPYADKLIACEVLTPGGNWSSYPPHRHDRPAEGESVLEEIYYFEVAGGGMAYQRVYGPSPDGARPPIDVLAEVRTGDAVLIPYGWHGPSMAAPGYDLYYLNVMAGPDPVRSWQVCDDPDHAWVRATWPDQPMDPRLPLTTREGPR